MYFLLERRKTSKQYFQNTLPGVVVVVGGVVVVAVEEVVGYKKILIFVWSTDNIRILLFPTIIFHSILPMTIIFPDILA